MLTEIEWWGGILFIWIAFSFITMHKEYSGEPKFEVGFVTFVLNYLLAAIVLALYFYVLESQLVKQLYIGSVTIGICFVAIWFFWPVKESVKENNESQEEAEEGGIGMEILGNLIILFPILVSFGLGAYKSLSFLDSLPFLN